MKMIRLRVAWFPAWLALLAVIAGLLPACRGGFGGSAHGVPAWFSPQGIVLAPVEVGGAEGQFLLDTGAEDTEVTVSFAAALEPVAETIDLYAPATGEQPVEIPAVRAGGIRFASGNLRYPELLGVVDFAPIADALQHELDGLLGWDVLREYVLGFDVAGRRLLAGRSLSVSEAFEELGMAADAAGLQLQIVGERPVVTAGSAGRSLRLLLDTGSGKTMIVEAAWARLGLEIAADAPTLVSRTATGLAHSRLATLDELRLGTLHLTDLPVAVTEHAPDAGGGAAVLDGILGMDVLSRHLVVIDGQARMLYLAPR